MITTRRRGLGARWHDVKQGIERRSRARQRGHGAHAGDDLRLGRRGSGSSPRARAASRRRRSRGCTTSARRPRRSEPDSAKLLAMFGLRYHVASLAAVFLALAVGILLGVAVSGKVRRRRGRRAPEPARRQRAAPGGARRRASRGRGRECARARAPTSSSRAPTRRSWTSRLGARTSRSSSSAPSTAARVPTSRALSPTRTPARRRACVALEVPDRRPELTSHARGRRGPRRVRGRRRFLRRSGVSSAASSVEGDEHATGAHLAGAAGRGAVRLDLDADRRGRGRRPTWEPPEGSDSDGRGRPETRRRRRCSRASSAASSGSGDAGRRRRVDATTRPPCSTPTATGHLERRRHRRRRRPPRPRAPPRRRRARALRLPAISATDGVGSADRAADDRG